MNEISNEFKFIELFAGVGGFRLGIEKAIPNSKCVFTNEWDKHAIQTYNSRFNENHKPIDIRTIKANELPDFDMLCGGFPCQTFSIAGKRKGFEDTRGTMFFEISRILAVKKPRLVFLENVKGLLNHDKGQTFRIIVQTLSELGYDVQWMVLNSKFFGVPQNRERVFIIGHLRGTTRPEILPFRQNESDVNSENEGQLSSSEVARCLTSTEHKQHGDGNYILSHSPRSGDPTRGGTGPLISEDHSFTLDTSPHYVIGDYRKDEGLRIRKNGESPTLTSHGNSNGGIPVPYVVGTFNIRRLTPVECERLQGFPDGWTAGVSDTQRYKQMGNAVTVNVIEAIAKKLQE